MRPPPAKLHRALGALLLLGALAGCARPALAPSPHAAAPAAAPIGSERHARVALERAPPPAPRERLVYLARELDDARRAELARVAPGVELVVGLSREEALARAGEVDALDGWYATAPMLRAASRLVWVQAGSAGVERYLALPELRESERVVLTNLRAVHGPAIADHAFAMLLALTRDLPVHLAGRAEGAWRREGSGELRPLALEGRTLLVVGLGGIGTEIARRGAGFGMRVLATRRSGEPGPPFVERVAAPEALLELLGEADVVALAVPLTADTERLMDARAFAALAPGAFLINVARGKVVDTEALLEALRSGRLAGACLDVTDPEPLPPEHPLWSLPNVVITPHVASEAELTDERAWALVRENLRRFDAGEPLLNVVDPAAGY